MNRNLSIAALLLLSLSSPLTALSRDSIDLAGRWNYNLTDLPDSLAAVCPPAGEINLPGTLDSNGIGVPVATSDVTDQLSRRFTYTGRASFSRSVEIPQSAAGKDILLNLERTRPSRVTVDGYDAGSMSELSATQTYDLSPLLSPGLHTIEITVDNGTAIPAAVRNSSHACTEATQTNWNGIIGDISLTIAEPTRLSALMVRPDPDTRSFTISATALRGDKNSPLTVRATCNGEVRTLTLDSSTPDSFTLTIPAGDDAELWSEWNPALHDVTVSLLDSEGTLLDSMTRRCGLRKFTAEGRRFLINGHPLFLRGRHDACVWPMTAHVPMDMESWQRYFSILKDYGINHVRFHSWCPPEACFAAADEAGVYLQPELPIWGEIDNENPELTGFLANDLEGILRDYSHHPSFTMFAIGNELWGDTKVMRVFIDRAREVNPDLLATYGSNIYLGYQGHIPGEDFLVTCRVGGGDGFSSHARASFSFADAEKGGIMNSTPPATTRTFSSATALSPVPVVGHETGQYQFYPDFKSIPKYTGVLRADNLMEFCRRAARAGTLRKSARFHKASGEWATRLYKEDMEMNLRTPDMGGFQLLDIQDYPGQGTALVGILDPFMDSKGFITPEQWRESCGEVTLLAALPERTFTAGEHVAVPVDVANYSGETIGDLSVEWTLSGSDKSLGGSLTPLSVKEGLYRAGTIDLTLPSLKRPAKMQLRLSTAQGAANKYDIWVYPSEVPEAKGVEITTDYRTALSLLEEGKRVILIPDSADVAATTLGGLFQTDYWNYRMFRTICDKMGKTPSPGTLGLLIDDSHPAFEYFPTDFHTDWQWFDIVSASRPLIIDRLPDTVDPIIEPIDNVDRNYRLSLMMECRVGKGRLLLLMADPRSIPHLSPARRAAAEWFIYSLENYVASKSFKPSLSLTATQLRRLLTEPSAARKIEQIRNISY